MANQIYIFDLDGTLADCEHRRHWLDKDAHPEMTTSERWERFFDPLSIMLDKVVSPIAQILRFIPRGTERASVWIWSARWERTRLVTSDWLFIQARIPTTAWSADYEGISVPLRMRPEGEFMPDEKLKESWLLDLPRDVRDSIACVFDDRDKVVRMWRSHGIRCCQVAQGDF